MLGFGKKTAIRKYQHLLGPELAQRYGGTLPYTQSQIDVTINDLRLSKKHINFAYLIYCKSENLDPDIFNSFATDKMLKIISAAGGSGLIGAAADSFAGGGDGGGGGGE